MKNFMCIAFSVPNDKMYPIPTYFEILSLRIIDRESYSCGPSNSFVPSCSKFFSVFGFYFPVLSSRNSVSKKVTVVFCCYNRLHFLLWEKFFQFHMWGKIIFFTCEETVYFLHTFVNKGCEEKNMWIHRKRPQQVRNNKKN